MFISRKNFMGLVDRVTKLERILEEVENRQVYYMPTGGWEGCPWEGK